MKGRVIMHAQSAPEGELFFTEGMNHPRVSACVTRGKQDTGAMPRLNSASAAGQI